MNPIQLSQQLEQTLINYLTTTFDVDRDGEEPALAEFIKTNLKRKRTLFTGPYLELTPPYQTGKSLEDLAREGVISPKLLQMACFQAGDPLPINVPLYTHQEAAIRQLATGRNVVVSSGTGSGKTEAFMIPLLNDLVQDPTPGVRAVLVYPLNALVNDQLDRLRKLLKGTGITFGRYTSELDSKEAIAKRAMQAEWEKSKELRDLFEEYPLPNEIIGRDQIQSGDINQLPQILITNYAMLEYLLLRPQDNPLFKHGSWKFIVLDEAHTYAGAQGIEVGMLVRRLKHRLGHTMQCIATSATLSSDKDKGEAKIFAEALFGEPFREENIILGEPNLTYPKPKDVRRPAAEIYLHPKFADLLEDVRRAEWGTADEAALLMQEIGLINEHELSWADDKKTPLFLHQVLEGNDRLLQLRQRMVEQKDPVEVETIAADIFPELAQEQQTKALYHLIELASMAREGRDKPSLLPARYHLFVRPPQGVWACINPTCPPDKEHRDETVWSKLFAAPRERCDVCNAPVYSVVVCRTCGQVYLRLYKVGQKYQAFEVESEDSEKRYFTWRPIRENRGLAEAFEIGQEDEEVEEDEMLAKAGEPILTQKAIHFCLQCQKTVNHVGRCGCTGRSEQTVTLYLMQKTAIKKQGKKVVKAENDVTHLNECGRCHSKALKTTEIGTDITLNAMTPLAVMTEELYRHLPQSSKSEAQKKPGNGRKLLSFYDSRQGAARFAAFMQDIVNQQAYRRLIVQAVVQNSTSTYAPALRKVCQTASGLAIDQRIAHNDPNIFEQGSDNKKLGGDEKEQVAEYLTAQLLAEITTGLRSRQSLEALGLLAVQYFEIGHEPDFDSLVQQLNLSQSVTRCLLEHLLDDLRRKKIVELPSAIAYNDPAFGRNDREWFLVRGLEQTSQEHSWLGATARYRRRRLVQKLLKGVNDDQVVDILNNIFTWLIDKSDLFHTDSRGSRLRHDRLFFQTEVPLYQCINCKRLSYRGDLLPCPHHGCHGQLQAVEETGLQKSNFYYGNLRQGTIPLRVEEHTAQLAPAKGRDYQTKFKDGDINMLSCSTTFEMGIDLGDLQAVVMSNIPPTVANYKQRTGRAGRRTSGTAFILAWASNRPHDQTYFRNPAEIISGRVRIPYIEIANKIIAQRHINAILLSRFFRFCQEHKGQFNDTVGSFFEAQTVGGAYYELFDSWFYAQKQTLHQMVQDYLPMIENIIDVELALNNFYQDVREKGFSAYERSAQHFKTNQQNALAELGTLITEGKSVWEQNVIQGQIRHYGGLLEREKNEDIIGFLSGRGVLPSYSFPLHTVELSLPTQKPFGRYLRLQRNLQQAIREYAPGQEIVADKRIWKSEGLDLRGKEPKTFYYHICPICNFLRLAELASQELDELDKACPICQTPPPKGIWKAHEYIQPDGFRAAADSGEPAGQYVDRPYNVMKSALVPSPIETQQRWNLLAIGYARGGALLYVNEGFKESGFRLCLNCGQQVLSKATALCPNPKCKAVVKRDARYSLGFQQNTDTLHLKFSGISHVSLPPADDPSFWLSLKYALLQGASRALQIERRDIDGVLFPEKIGGESWRQTIVLYDNVPGGAGHVKRIQDEMPVVIQAALEIVGCDTEEQSQCEKSCYRCLQEYANQYEHHLLDRKPVQAFLQALAADLQGEIEGSIKGLHGVVAADQLHWLWEQISHTQQELMLWADHLTQASPTADGHTWLDLLQDLLQRQIKVTLHLRELPNVNSGRGEDILLAIHLRLLLGKGLDLRQSKEDWEWTAVIDGQGTQPRAVQTTTGKHLVLGADSMLFNATSHSAAVAQIWTEEKRVRCRLVNSHELQEPANTRVVEVISEQRSHTEADYFTDFYARPIRKMTISDPYIYKEEHILVRLVAHITLAQKGEHLEEVIVTTEKPTRPFSPNQEHKLRQDQNDASTKLKQRFPFVQFNPKPKGQVPHDRFIDIERVDKSKARLILGKGLDFIHEDKVDHTFLIFQDPL